ncbi:MAG TPA: hypothetical protein VMT58_10010, partial [Candidatus Binataceae bacterium]|nr:hypothetical protein [Candidatus Binataceae bacterium]
MRQIRNKYAIYKLWAAAILLGAVMAPIAAHSASGSMITVYADPATGQLYYKPGKHRVRLGQYVPIGATEEIERRVGQKAQEQVELEQQQLRSELQSK